MVKSTRHIGFAFLIVCALIIPSCGPSEKVELDPEARSFYETARLIMSREEGDIFIHLPDAESRQEFIQDFWLKRDPDPGTEENEFKEEFFRRVEYASERFKEGMPGWKTDRGRIYIYFGDPDRIEQHPFVERPIEKGYKGYILWVYYRYELALEFLDKGDGGYTLDPDPYTGGIYGNIFEAMERAKFGLVYTDEVMKKKFLNFDLKFEKGKREIILSIPAKSLTFVEEEGLLKADFDFIFYVYEKGEGKKQTFEESRHFEGTEEQVLGLKHLTFSFSFEELEPGKYYFDVVVIARPDIGKARKIFGIKI